MIIDTTGNAAQQIPHLQADGITTVIRYLTTNTRSFKLIRAQEAKDLGTYGIRVGLVFETGGGAPGQLPLNAQMGLQDGSFAAQYAPTVGAPKGAAVYFAADNDFSASQIQNSILPYFNAVCAAMKDSGLSVGVYGSGAVCEAVIGKTGTDLAWLSGSMGWTDSKAYLASKPAALRLVQDKMDTRIANMDCDTDYELGDFGDFLPFAAASPVVASAQPIKPTMYERLMGMIS